MLTKGQAHAGVIVATQVDPRQNLRALFNLLNTLSAEALQDNPICLNNWAQHTSAAPWETVEGNTLL